MIIATFGFVRGPKADRMIYGWVGKAKLAIQDVLAKGTDVREFAEIIRRPFSSCSGILIFNDFRSFARTASEGNGHVCSHRNRQFSFFPLFVLLGSAVRYSSFSSYEFFALLMWVN